MTISYIIIAFVFSVFIYFGYKDDYKRDKNGFKTTVFRIIGTLICLLIVYIILDNTRVPFRKVLIEFYPSEIFSIKDLKKMSHKDLNETIANFKAYEKKIDLTIDVFNLVFFYVVFLLLNKLITFFKNRKI